MRPLRATIDIQPLRFANVAVGGPRRLSAALITQLDAGHVYFLEMTGVHPEEERANRDIGTFLVNCAIQAIVPLYPKPAHVLLFGRVVCGANVAPTNDSEATTLARAMSFWERFGFSFRVFDNGVSPQLSGTLSQLHIAEGKGTCGEFPHAVPLWQFDAREFFPAAEGAKTRSSRSERCLERIQRRANSSGPVH
jgi:hypothetical protein